MAVAGRSDRYMPKTPPSVHSFPNVFDDRRHRRASTLVAGSTRAAQVAPGERTAELHVVLTDGSAVLRDPARAVVGSCPGRQTVPDVPQL